MSAGTSIALTTVRIPRGQSRPSDETFHQALEGDRTALGLAPAGIRLDFTIAGPYPIVVDGAELDEYVAWEK